MKNELQKQRKIAYARQLERENIGTRNYIVWNDEGSKWELKTEVPHGEWWDSNGVRHYDDFTTDRWVHDECQAQSNEKSFDDDSRTTTITDTFWLARRKYNDKRDIVCQQITKDGRGVTLDVVWFMFGTEDELSLDTIQNSYTLLWEIDLDSIYQRKTLPKRGD